MLLLPARIAKFARDARGQDGVLLFFFFLRMSLSLRCIRTCLSRNKFARYFVVVVVGCM